MKTQHIHMIENFSICQKDLAVLIKYLGKEADKYGCAVSLNTLWNEIMSILIALWNRFNTLSQIHYQGNYAVPLKLGGG